MAVAKLFSHYCVKVIDKEKILQHYSEEKAKKFIDREIEFLQKNIGEPHIVQMLDYCWSSDYDCIILMERNRGVTLKELNLKVISKVSIWERIEILKKIANHLINALYSMEKNEICHRDIKPDNVLIDLSKEEDFREQLNLPVKDLSWFSSNTNFIVKVADFGASKGFDSLSSFTAIGNMKYKANEVDEDNNSFSKADVWSVGVMILDLLIPDESWEISSYFSFANIGFTLPKLLNEFLTDEIDERFK